jgi:fatty-acyl-CoA synthase
MTRLQTRYSTVSEAVRCAGRDYPDRGFTFQDVKGRETFYSFEAIERETARRAAALAALGVRERDRIALVLILPEEFILTLLALIRLGAVAVPVAPPPYLNAIDVFLDDSAAILRSCAPRLVVCSASILETIQTAAGRAGIPRAVVDVADLAGDHPPVGEWPVPDPGDVVFLQYTSGSTGAPKGVMMTNWSLIGNINGFMGEGLQMVSGRDVGISWLPLHHDMGLIGFVLGPICWGVSVTFIPTVRFIVNPSSWFDAIHRHRGTVSFGPNFAYALSLKKVKPHLLEQWDLSSMKAFGCGAEPILPATLKAFARLFGEKCGLRPNAVMPAYGLAESTLAVTMKPLDESMRTWLVDPQRFEHLREAAAPPHFSDREPLEHVSCGTPFFEHELRVVDDHGAECPETAEGEILVRGRSVTAGYWSSSRIESAVSSDGWLQTGDLGYLRSGELYVTGRCKDLIIISGRNVHPQTIEWVASDIPGVRRGSVVAFSKLGPAGEEVVVACETAVTDRDRLANEVDYAIRRSHQLPRVEVVCFAPGELPKTTSGKVKRQHVRQLYLRSQLASAS